MEVVQALGPEFFAAEAQGVEISPHGGPSGVVLVLPGKCDFDAFQYIAGDLIERALDAGLEAYPAHQLNEAGEIVIVSVRFFPNLHDTADQGGDAK